MRGKHPDAVRRLLVQQLEPATRLLPDVCPRAGTVERVLLAVTAGVRAPLLSLTARAADVSLRLPPSKWILAGARPPPGPSPRSPAPTDRLLREVRGAGSVSLGGFVKSPLDLQRSKGSRAPITARPAGHVLPLQGFYVRWRRRRQIDPMGFASKSLTRACGVKTLGWLPVECERKECTSHHWFLSVLLSPLKVFSFPGI